LGNLLNLILLGIKIYAIIDSILIHNIICKIIIGIELKDHHLDPMLLDLQLKVTRMLIVLKNKIIKWKNKKFIKLLKIESKKLIKITKIRDCVELPLWLQR
jgi:hypothetical protein